MDAHQPHVAVPKNSLMVEMATKSFTVQNGTVLSMNGAWLIVKPWLWTDVKRGCPWKNKDMGVFLLWEVKALLFEILGPGRFQNSAMWGVLEAEYGASASQNQNTPRNI